MRQQTNRQMDTNYNTIVKVRSDDFGFMVKACSHQSVQLLQTRISLLFHGLALMSPKRDLMSR